MRLHPSLLLLAPAALCLPLASAPAAVTVGHAGDSATHAFATDKAPAPAADDLAAKATVTVVDGAADPASAGPAALTDGKLATQPDDPGASFFFADGNAGGRVVFDLGEPKAIAQINTYSWHPTDRGPQVYKVYGNTGAEPNFNPSLKAPKNPIEFGWTQLASVDTRGAAASGGTADPGGQYAVSVAAKKPLKSQKEVRPLGTFRYVLFDISRTESEDQFGNTFYTEIDLIAPGQVRAPTPTTRPGGDPATRPITVTIDTTGLSPEMTRWAHEKLEPVCDEWYPKIVKMLPSEGYVAPRDFTIMFRDDMGGTPAAASGTRVMCNRQWFEQNKDGEGVGAVVHEMVHVVQHYRFGRKSVPFWLQEGIPDYIRWYLYEPEKHGARIRNVEAANYDQAYRVSANFLNWATNTYDKKLVPQLNAAIRQGKYTDEIWVKLTGKELEALNKEWKASLAKG